MHTHSERPGSVLQHVSQNIRQLRVDSGFSQSALSERSGVSRRMLVAIEAGEKNVSLATLDLIAAALAVPFSRLVQAPDQRDLSRINELAWAGRSAGSKALLLGASQATREVELWEWRLEPGECYFSEADAEGWSEQIYVAEGCLTLVIEDVERRVHAGEFHVFASNCRYSYRNDESSLVRFVRNVVI
ncbi:helix-turn-helix domain-containing protein [Pseudomonas cremoricolorata]|uniref:helix-turn-helix domain-containing protein n=1 Tax=Pseudomonas cremoricolorata TaxID=157783 RepID=UPI00048D394B|nr:XRE family transcriptional regulator [Pseudomonas cremoricolorata]